MDGKSFGLLSQYKPYRDRPQLRSLTIAKRRVAPLMIPVKIRPRDEIERSA